MLNKIKQYFVNLKNELTSRTIKSAYVLQVFAFVQLALPEARELLGIYYGITLLLVGEVVKYYRRITTQPL